MRIRRCAAALAFIRAHSRAAIFACISAASWALATTAVFANPPRTVLAEAPRRDFLADGTELVVTSIPGARRVSFRYLVRAGGASDPANQEGMAHLLEHLVFHGNYTVDQPGLFHLARANGAYLNAFTGSEHTVYVLDTPSAHATSLLSTYVSVLTNPVLAPRHVDLERDVISAESVLRPSEGLHGLMSQLLLPGLQARGGIIGTEKSRSQITREDVLAFHERNYRPENITIILAGDIDPETARSTIDAASLLAPGESRAAARPETAALSTPVDARAPAPFYGTLFGYDLSGVDRSTCRGLADLLDLRLNIALAIERPVADRLSATCMILRGQQILLAFVTSRSHVGIDLPDLVRRAFRDLQTRAPTTRERDHLTARSLRRRTQMLREPEAVADALVEALAGERPGTDYTQAFASVFEPAPLDAAAMRRAAEQCFIDDRRVQIELAPF